MSFSIQLLILAVNGTPFASGEMLENVQFATFHMWLFQTQQEIQQSR